MATLPRQNDILFGKGNAINTHHGNKHFRSLVEVQKPKFRQSFKKAKRVIAHGIIDDIYKMGGRFLMEDPNSKGNVEKEENKGVEGQTSASGNVVTQKIGPNKLVTDPLILKKVWVGVERDGAIVKVMHRLREKPANGSLKNQPKEEEKKMLPPPDTKSSETDLVAPAKAASFDKIGSVTQSEYAKSGSPVQKEEAKVESRCQPMEGLADAPVPVTIQSAHQPVINHNLSQVDNLSSVSSMSNASVPVSIHKWMRSAIVMSLSFDEYLENAIRISILLTQHLIQLIAAAEITLPDISIENVTILMEPLIIQSANSLPIESVQLKSSALLSAAGYPLPSRAVCGELGKILLDIFSKGRSSSHVSGTSSTFDTTQWDQSIMPHAQRVKLSVPVVGSTSTMAKRLLLELGMPMSIYRLVCDLLDAINEPCPGSAFTSLEELLWDLTQMKNNPQHFVFDRVCPQKALHDTCLFGCINTDLFGREEELGILMKAKQRIFNHVQKGNVEDPINNGECRNVPFGKTPLGKEIHFQCEAVFLSGYAGGGKSSLLHTLIHACEQDWFIIHAKFDKHVAPSTIVAKGFDDFFGKWILDNNGGSSDLDPAMVKSFHQICQSISSSIDKEGLHQLREIIPNLGRAIPGILTQTQTQTHIRKEGPSSIDKVGSTSKRVKHLLQVLLRAMCSVGRPVLMTHDDVQWTHSLDGLKEFIVNYAELPCATKKEARYQGFMIVGTFRSNEAKASQGITKTIASIEQSKSAQVTTFTIGELSYDDIGRLISKKLCLPMRYTSELAELVLSKTRGSPFFVVQFLKSIIQNQMLEFSVQSRRWTWDCDVIDMQTISDGVAQLLLSQFSQLPFHLMQTARVASCFGSQIDDITIGILNTGQHFLPFNMEDALQSVIKEGIMERAGPIYQFTHDLIQQTIYESIPANDQIFLHKTIGTILLLFAGEHPTVHLLAVDQINIYSNSAFLSPDECSQCAEINATAAKFSIDKYRFEKAHSYVSMGMKMLGSNHWEDQYSLSLKLYEMSALLSFIGGGMDTMSNCLNEIIPNVKSFEDSLTSSSLLAKLLAASSKYDEAIRNSLVILSTLGEDFPQDPSLSMVLNELSVIRTTLANITLDQVKQIPRMTDKSKLNTMQFLSMSCEYSMISKPMLVPLLSCRMVRLTIENGFCDDSIIGLVTAGYGLFSFTDNDEELGYRIAKVGEALIEESPNRHALRSRLLCELDINLKAFVEPIQSVMSTFPDKYNSAMHAGDVGTSLVCFRSYCALSLFTGSELIPLKKDFVRCTQQLIKYQQITGLDAIMPAFRALIYLSGQNNVGVDVKSYEELNEIAVRTCNKRLLYHILVSQIFCHFFLGDYLKVMELSEKYNCSGVKALAEVFRVFCEGIASFSLARHTCQVKQRIMGEKSLKKMLKWEKISIWNWGNMAKLLQAEFHYLNGDLQLADVAYRASIVSAREHKYIHFEALAYELYGIFCLENQMREEGHNQLKMALKKYKQWGALKKVSDLQIFMDSADAGAVL